MNPLSAWTYNLRHKRRTMLLLGLIILVTFGVYFTGAVTWGVFIEPARESYMALSKFNLVTPRSGSDVLAKIEANPNTAVILPTKTIIVNLPTILPEEDVTFRLLGLNIQDIPQMLEAYDATIIDGKLPANYSNGILFSEEIANMLGLEVGDIYELKVAEVYGEADDPNRVTEMEVVGILKSDVRLGIISLDFLNDHSQFRLYPDRYLISANKGQESVLDEFLRNEIPSSDAEVQTLSILNERIINEALPGLALLSPAILIVILAFVQVVITVNRIANLNRMPELGILNAIGHGSKWLIKRMTTETAAITIIGWIIGIVIAWAALHILNVSVLLPRGQDLKIFSWLPLLFVIPIPIMTTGLSRRQIRKHFESLDVVTIIEQRNSPRNKDNGTTATRNYLNPLTPLTYFKRHKHQSRLLIIIMALIIFGVTLIAFILGLSADAQESLVSYLRYVNIVQSPGIIQSLDPEIRTKIESHPSVDRVIQVAPRFHIISAWIPPFVSYEASPFAVNAEDMNYLVELYGLKLKEGRLPQAGTNEMVIPEFLAMNRNISIGDVIGDPQNPIYPGAETLASTFKVVGIFSESQKDGEDNWWGFISLEYIKQKKVIPLPENLPLIIVPKSGEKDALDDWMRKEFSISDASILTLEDEIEKIKRSAQNQTSSIMFLQAIIAVLSAIGIAIMGYIYISQRKAEFGILNAIGFNRNYLIKRVVKETGLQIFIAWGLSAISIFLVLFILRFGVYESIGLTFNILKIAPWFYTLPIPLVVIVVTSGTIKQVLSNLDPISIIERR